MELCGPIIRMSGNSVDIEGSTDKVENENLDLQVDYSLKHPLQHTWTLWFYENDRSNTWKENQKEIASFNTVEDFWSLYNHIKLASDLRQGCDYSLFKQGILPMWEDDANKRGGRWLISLDKKQRSTELDRYWLDVILLMIGEAFDNSDDICGAVVNIRGKGDKIGVWTADLNRGNACIEIGRKIKERLRMPPKVQISYQGHQDTMIKSGSVTKITYTV